MGKSWDSSGIAFQPDTWRKCYQVLKPGGHLLVFGGSRTFHRVACAVEDAGFEIRDTIMWIFGQGFPKSMNLGLAIDRKNGVESEVVGSKGTMPDFVDAGKKNSVNKIGVNDGESAERAEYLQYKARNEWDGWGTTLKPAYESIIVARKPCKGTCIDNVLMYGVGGINIDECRVPLEEGYEHKETQRKPRVGTVFSNESCGINNVENHSASADEKGRFPANVILTYDESDFDEVCGGFPVTKSTGGSGKASATGGLGNNVYGKYNHDVVASHLGGLGDSGSAARYFYCAKASKRDRDEGLDEFETKQCTGGGGGIGDYLDDVNSCSGKFGSEKAPHKNIHPTVKPTSLMGYLVRLVTPRGGTVLDPFNGSGSTGKACMYENKDRNAGYKYIGIDLSEEYLKISDARIRYAISSDVAPAEYSSGSQQTPNQNTPVTPKKKKPSSNRFF